MARPGRQGSRLGSVHRGTKLKLGSTKARSDWGRGVAPSCPDRPDLQFQRGRRAREQAALVGSARSALIRSTSSEWRNSAASCAVAVAVWRSGGLRLTVQVEQSIEFRVNNAQGAVNVVLEIGH